MCCHYKMNPLIYIYLPNANFKGRTPRNWISVMVRTIAGVYCFPSLFSMWQATFSWTYRFQINAMKSRWYLLLEARASLVVSFSLTQSVTQLQYFKIYINSLNFIISDKRKDVRFYMEALEICYTMPNRVGLNFYSSSMWKDNFKRHY